VDPVTHTFVGASLGATGLRRSTPLAMATLMVGANAPDVDILAQSLGPYGALAIRRGITHGIPALLVLPLLVAGGVLAWDRWARRRRRPHLPPARPVAVLGLAALGVWTHSPLDWLNEYGMRWLLPFDGRWSYGDAVFIIDPWLWLALGGALFVVHSRRAPARIFWASLAAAMSFLILGVPVVPTAAKALWVAGLAGWIAIRVRLGGDPDPARARRIVRIAAAGAVLYAGAMVLQNPVQARVALADAERRGLGPIEAVMVGPVPANPFRGRVVLSTPERYWLGDFRWSPQPVVRFRPEPIPRPPPERPPLAAALGHPDARRYLVWSRFPVYDVQPVPEGWRVRIRDARYLGRDGAALDGPTIFVNERLEPST
jgi:inner membrane protein